MVDDKPQLEIQHPYLKLPDLELIVKHNSMAGVVNTVLKMFNGMICSRIESTVSKLIIVGLGGREELTHRRRATSCWSR